MNIGPDKILSMIPGVFIPNREKLKIDLHPPSSQIPPRPHLFSPSSRLPSSKGGWEDFIGIAIIVALVFTLSTLWSCDYGRMNDQESVRSYEKEIPEMDQGTIPMNGGIQILKTADPKELKNPLSFSPESVAQGKQAYSYFCVQCHGPLADGNGTVGQSFAPLPTNLRAPGVQKQGDGELFSKISLGFNRHPPLATTVSEEDRWATVNYIRSLIKKTSTG
jgi:mono/diheme cytochrome c family protein